MAASHHALTADGRDRERGVAAAALTRVVHTYGWHRLQEPSVVHGTLNDSLGVEAMAVRQEVKLLADAAAQGIPALLASGTWAQGDVGERRLVAMGSAPGLARWAVDTWAAALGVGSDPVRPSSGPATPIATAAGPEVVSLPSEKRWVAEKLQSALYLAGVLLFLFLFIKFLEW